MRSALLWCEAFIQDDADCRQRLPPMRGSLHASKILPGIHAYLATSPRDLCIPRYFEVPPSPSQLIAWACIMKYQLQLLQAQPHFHHTCSQQMTLIYDQSNLALATITSDPGLEPNKRYRCFRVIAKHYARIACLQRSCSFLATGKVPPYSQMCLLGLSQKVSRPTLPLC